MPTFAISRNDRAQTLGLQASTGSASASAWEDLLADLREHNERYEQWRKQVMSLASKIDSLRTWGQDWDDYDAPPPSDITIHRADEWARALFQEAAANRRPWYMPLITANEEGDVTFEWRRGDLRLTISVSEGAILFSKLTRTGSSYGFEEGSAETREQRRELWAWLVG